MATRNPTVTYAPNGQANMVAINWSGLLNGDAGAPFEGIDWADRTAQISGAFGTGGSITLEGSNDGTNYLALTDPQGNAITKTAAALETIEEGPRYTRPRVTAGDGTTNLTAVIYARRSR